ncbi:MAG: SCP2 sterol-binding domain-containing protein [Pseudonocardiaceae bacterium]
MVERATKAEWQQGQDALRDAVGRVTALLRSVDNPGLHAVGQWDLSEVAMHLSQAWAAVPGLARRDLSPVYEVVPGLADQAGDSLIHDLWDLGEITTLAVNSDPERDPRVLADRIEARAQEYLSECEGADPDAPRAWLVEGATVRRSTLTFYFTFNQGELTVEEPSSREVDCVITADPVALLMVAWGRKSQWPLITEGKLETGGPKAYLGPQFRSLIRNP